MDKHVRKSVTSRKITTHQEPTVEAPRYIPRNLGGTRIRRGGFSKGDILFFQVTTTLSILMLFAWMILEQNPNITAGLFP